jgi:hypothetical protein
MRLSNFLDTVVRADAQYFRDQGFISEGECQRVLRWLDGAKDAEIEHRVIGWLKADAKYLAENGRAAAKLLWYIWPFVILGVWVMRRVVERGAQKLAW